MRVFVIRVPLDLALDAELIDREEQAAASLAEARLLGDENGVRVEPVSVRARSIGQAIVEQAVERGRRSDRARLVAALAAPVAFFSPTVDYVLRNAPCEVLVVAFPQGVLEDVP